MTDCWFAALPDAGPCEGQLVACHLIDQQQIRKAFPKGAVWADGRWWRAGAAPLDGDETPRYRTVRQLQQDPRSFVPGCGGLVGLSGHHGKFDSSPHERTRLRVPRETLPDETEEYAVELGLDAWLERTYGPLSSNA